MLSIAMMANGKRLISALPSLIILPVLALGKADLSGYNSIVEKKCFHSVVSVLSIKRISREFHFV